MDRSTSQSYSDARTHVVDLRGPATFNLNQEFLKYDPSKRIVIACGPNHNLAIGSNEGLYGWGINEFSQLGSSQMRDVLEYPEQIGLLHTSYCNVLQVSCGMKHSAVLAYPFDSQETNKFQKTVVFTFGCSDNGRLGRDFDEEEDEESQKSGQEYSQDLRDNLEVCTPVKALLNRTIRMVACGGAFTMALSNEGNIYSWGHGASGALGIGRFDDAWEPQMIVFDRREDITIPIKFIAAGYTHALAVSLDGDLYAWGNGEMGQLGNGTTDTVSKPVKAKTKKYKIDMVAGGMYHTIALTEDQMILACGANKNGQLGFIDMANRTEPEEVTAFTKEPATWVACGSNHTLVLSLSHKVFAFGNNAHYKCGVEDSRETGKNIAIPTQVRIPLQEFDYVYQIAASLNLSMAISKGGQIFTWGKDKKGLLGRITGEGVVMTKEDDDMEDINMGNNAPYPIEGNYLKREGIEADEDRLSSALKDIKCGFFHTVALTNAGEVYVWGSNEFGQHGISSEELQKKYEILSQKHTQKKLAELPPECMPSLILQFDIKQNKRITSIGTGYYHIIAVENHRKVYAWGRNTEGQLGLGYSNKEVTTPTVISELNGIMVKEIAASEAHTLVLTETGDVFSFGSPLYGKLGLGVSSSLQLVPRKIRDLKKAIMVRCGPTHSMALAYEDDEYNVYSWGNGRGGKLGHGNVDNYFVPTKIETSINFRYISCGTNHSAGINEKGKIYAWGPREYFGVVEKRVGDISGASEIKLSDLYMLKPTLFEPPVFEDSQFTSVVLGNRYNLALTENNILYKWGMFDNMYEKEFHTQDKDSRTQKNLDEILNIEKHFMVLKSTFQSFEMQDLIVRLDCSANHAAAISTRYGYSWGLDLYTGRLGHYGGVMGDHDIEFQANTKDTLTELIDRPKIIKFLSSIFNVNIQKINAQRQIEVANDAQSGKTKRSGKSRKSGISDSRRMGSIVHSSKLRRKSNLASTLNISGVASLAEIQEEGHEDHGNKRSLKWFLGAFRESEATNLYNTVLNKTKITEKRLKNINEKFAELKAMTADQKNFAASVESMIVKKLTSKPFSITPSLKHVYKFPKEFAENTTPYNQLYTVLQLHPCYIANMYKTRKISNDKLLEIIKEIYGDLAGDKRKTRLFMAMSIQILKLELEKIDDPLSLVFDEVEDEPNSTPLFARLFIHLLKSNNQNIEYLDSVKLKIMNHMELVLQGVSNKWLKQYAFVFKGEEVEDIMERYKNETDAFRVGELEKNVNRVKETLAKVMEDISKKTVMTKVGTEMKKTTPSKDIKYMLKKTMEITRECFENSGLLVESIQNKASALVFALIREKLKKAYYKKQQGENLVNLGNLVDAVIMCIRGDMFSSEDRKWVLELNNQIMKLEEQRRHLCVGFVTEDYDLDEKIMKSTFAHACENENDTLQCTIKNIAYLTKFICENSEAMAVIQPAKLDYLSKFKEKLNSQFNYGKSVPSIKESQLIVNIKLKTRQFLYGGVNTIKVCNDCGAYLKDALVSTNSKHIIEQIEKDDPKSLQTYYRKFLLTLDNHKVEHLFHEIEDFDTLLRKQIEGFKVRHDYGKLTDTICFTNALQAECERINPFLFVKTGPEVSKTKYKLLNELQGQALDRLNHLLTYQDYIEYLGDILDKKILGKIEEKIDSKNDEIKSRKSVVDAINYGTSIQNQTLDRMFTQNRQSVYSELKAQLNRKRQSKDLVENLNVDEKRKLELFGIYSLATLKQKNILKSFTNPTVTDENSDKKKKINGFSLVFTKEDDKYIVTLIRSKKKGLLGSLLGEKKLKGIQMGKYEETLDEVIISEHQILHARKHIKKLKEGAEVTKIGEYVQLNTTKFLELLDALDTNQGIYEQQIVKRNNFQEILPSDKE